MNFLYQSNSLNKSYLEYLSEIKIISRIHGSQQNVIADDESLVDTLKDYQELTGICPVIYTAVHEDWKDDYDSLEDYSFYTYTSNFKDEAHFVIVYSVPVSDLEYIGQEPGFVPDFKWEATQGDDTDPIITESYFKKFADKVQDGLESGEDAGVAFDEAFKFAYKKAENQLDPGSASRMPVHRFMRE